MNFNVPGDLALTPDRSDLLVVTGAESLRTRMLQGFVQFLGTWRYNTVTGVRADRIFGKNDITVVKAEVARFLRTFSEVTEINKINVQRLKDRSSVIEWDVQSIYGPVEIIAPLDQFSK